MPIQGFFKTGIQLLPAPYVQALVILPRLQVSAQVDFLIDTGSDTTNLHPQDTVRFPINFQRMRRSTLRYAWESGAVLLIMAKRRC